MKRIMVLILAVVLVTGVTPQKVLRLFGDTGVAYAKGLEVKQRAGDYNVEVRLDKNPPVVGNNDMEITITDASGRAVTDAKVLVNYSMPPMPGMPAANYKAIASLKGTTYAATLNPSMSGAWSVALKITKGGKTSTVKFNIDVQ